MVDIKIDTHDIKRWVRKAFNVANDLHAEQLKPVVKSLLNEIIDATPLQSAGNRTTWLDYVLAVYGYNMYRKMASGEYFHSIGQLRRSWVMDEEEAADGTAITSGDMAEEVDAKAMEIAERMANSNSGGTYSKYYAMITNSSPYWEFRDMPTHATKAPDTVHWLTPAQQLPTSFYIDSILEDATHTATRVLVDDVIKPYLEQI